MLTKIAKAAYISTVKVGIEVLSVTTLLRRRNVETMNTIGIIVVAILVVIVVVVTSQWDKEVQIRKKYDKYFFDIVDGKQKFAEENLKLRQENINLSKQLNAAQNDIKIVEDTYKSKIDELEQEIVNLNYKKQLEDGTLEFKDILEPTEVQEDEDQETKD
jgi:hypothetical protein|uniref:Uncharacterized protein n=1 Tax=Siphoviridae sp. ctOrJ23 TaxID=2825481 RepID=A0A8S5Q2D3_9CAUD|nr:MAG TPA: hypothetical protein [Siphoviridae sp. ctOrJ23]